MFFFYKNVKCFLCFFYLQTDVFGIYGVALMTGAVCRLSNAGGEVVPHIQRSDRTDASHR